MTNERSSAQLDEASRQLSARSYGGEAAGSTDQLGDDASGQFWLVTDQNVPLALRVSLATGRPLLVKGDPGTGKSTLARAVAHTLGWRYLSITVTSRTEASDLLWHVDHLARLRDAQIGDESSKKVDDELNYVRPGPMWWALSPTSAIELPSTPADPCPNPAGMPAVILIDEIDKADPEMPNNLLEALGWLKFRGPGSVGTIGAASGDSTPLIIITSNNERDLSPAFLRRCVKLELGTPNSDELRAIALGHLPHDPDSVAAIDAVHDLMTATDDGVTPAAYVDAARAARSFKLTAGSPELIKIRQLLLDLEDGQR